MSSIHISNPMRQSGRFSLIKANYLKKHLYLKFYLNNFLVHHYKLSKCDYFYISGFEAFEDSLFKIGCRSMPHGGVFNCRYFPLPYEFSLAMGISFGVTSNFLCEILS